MIIEVFLNNFVCCYLFDAKKKLVIFLILYKVIKNLFVVINIILSNAKAKCFKNTSKHYKTEVYFSSALQFK